MSGVGKDPPGSARGKSKGRRKHEFNEQYQPERISNRRAGSTSQRQVQQKQEGDKQARLPKHGPGKLEGRGAQEIEGLHEGVHYCLVPPFFLALINVSSSARSSAERSPVSSRLWTIGANAPLK